MSIVFVNGQVHQTLPANSEVAFVNGQIVQTLGITPVVPEPEEEPTVVAIQLTPLEQLAQDLLGTPEPELLLDPHLRQAHPSLNRLLSGLR
tara:strand:+ start:514 stop:786 length:273 start_codon:yes stop_codon:yes gene_type:complete